MLQPQALNKIGTETPTALALSSFLGSLERNRAQTSLPRALRSIRKAGCQVVLSHFHLFWRELEGSGVGYTQPKRKGKEPRFVWHYQLKTVAEALLTGELQGDPSRLPPAPVPKAVPKVSKQAYTQVTLDTGSPLRTIRIDVPNDVSNEEIERVRRALLDLG